MKKLRPIFAFLVAICVWTNLHAADGDFGFAQSFGGAQPDEAVDVAADPSGNLIIASSMYGSAAFGSTSLTSQGMVDMVLAKVSPAGSVLWAANKGTAVEEFVRAVAVDANGDIIAVGHFRGGSTNLGGSSLTPPENSFSDIFVAKYSGSNGSHIWSKRFGGNGEDVAAGVAIDANKNIYVTGSFVGAVSFEVATLTSAGGGDGFVLKINPTGSVQWAKRFGGTMSPDMGNAVAADANGNTFVVGLVNGAVDFGNGSSSGGPSFICKYDTNGAAQWVKRPGTDVANTYFSDIAVDAGGTNLAVTGSFAGAVDFGSGSALNSTGAGLDVVVGKYLTSNGSCVWAKAYGGAEYEAGSAVTFDSNGHVAVAGSFNTTTSFGGSTLLSKGGHDAFAAKFSGTNGSPLWSKRTGGVGGDGGLSLASGGAGAIYALGSFQSTADFGSTALVSSDETSRIFFGKFNGSGALTHPADENNDMKISITEASHYSSCYFTPGCAWATGPNPLPVDYMVRGFALWKTGEAYHQDSSAVCPACWVSGP